RGTPALCCCLETAEEKQPFLHDWSANRSTKLVSFQAVSRGRKSVARIEMFVAQEFEQVAVKLVCSGFRHTVNRACRVMSILGGNSAGLDAEFLQCIRKRQWQCLVVEGVVVHSAVQHVYRSRSET